jgi:hypothetical protein
VECKAEGGGGGGGASGSEVEEGGGGDKNEVLPVQHNAPVGVALTKHN